MWALDRPQESLLFCRQSSNPDHPTSEGQRVCAHMQMGEQRLRDCYRERQGHLCPCAQNPSSCCQSQTYLS